LIDYGKQSVGDLIAGWVKYPFVLGSDVAGEVVEVGEGIERFNVGDRVVALAAGMDKRSIGAPEGASQLYSVVRDNLCSPIPDSMSYADASVIPLGVCTAACGMFMKDYSSLYYPKVTSKPTGEVYLIWGGSTSVGCNAIQLAVGAGYEVITTASPKNFAMLKSWGHRTALTIAVLP
jgi:NADPH:quinone reductase-like Zn-dependent oxidoreductase